MTLSLREMWVARRAMLFDFPSLYLVFYIEATTGSKSHGDRNRTFFWQRGWRYEERTSITKSNDKAQFFARTYHGTSFFCFFERRPCDGTAKPSRWTSKFHRTFKCIKNNMLQIWQYQLHWKVLWKLPFQILQIRKIDFSRGFMWKQTKKC